MISYKQYDDKLNCIKDEQIEYHQLKEIYSNFNERDIRIIKLDFEGDIAQIITKSNGFLIKLYPIACIFKSDEPKTLIVLNTQNQEVKEYCNYMIYGNMKIKNLTMISFFDNILSYHSDNLDKKIKKVSSEISRFTFDNIQSQHLGLIAKIFHDLLLIKNQYQEIQQTLTQINEWQSNKTKIVQESGNVEEFNRIINIYQNQFEEDVKNLNRMVKEIEILIQMTDIKFAERRNKIAITSLNLDIVILIVAVISMFGSIFGMNLDSSLEELSYGLYIILLFIIFLTLIFYYMIKIFLIKTF